MLWFTIFSFTASKPTADSSKPAESSATSVGPPPSLEGPPAFLHSLAVLQGFRVTLNQTVVAIETGSVPKTTGLQLSVEKLSGGLDLKQGEQGQFL